MTEPKTTTLTLDTAWIGEASPKLSDEYPHVTCQHVWQWSDMVLMSNPPIYSRTCKLCGEKQRISHGRITEANP